MRRRIGRDGARPIAGSVGKSAGAEEAALSAHRQERDLPVHGRRAEPSGAVRLQAATSEVRRNAAARRLAEGLSRGVYQSEFEIARSEIQVRQIRTERG